MYVGIDVGGTKTLIATLDDNGVILEKVKYPTPESYDIFLDQLAATLNTFNQKDYRAGGIGIPATVFDREHERAISFGNLPWKNVSVQQDTEIICHCPMVVENDAKLAGLSESMLLKSDYNKVLFITVSTGIGFSLINQHEIDINFGDSGGHSLLVAYKGKQVPWESFASGHAIVERFGKKAFEITDEETWAIIARDLSIGLIELIAMTEPDVIVIGGSVGTYFNRFSTLLKNALENYRLPLIAIPPIVGAQRPDDAVIYGCYDLAKQVYIYASNNN